MAGILDGVRRSVQVPGPDGRSWRFPSRSDYVEYLLKEAQLASRDDFLKRPDMVEAVYLDWLRRGQVGCVFAQLLGRSANRAAVRTVVFPASPSSQPEAKTLAAQIQESLVASVRDPAIQGLTVLLPSVEHIEQLVQLAHALSTTPGWRLQSPTPWKRTLTLLGLRANVGGDAWAEVLGMGPFPQCMPPTRRCPITSIEIRTKTAGGLRSKVFPDELAVHLAQLPMERMSSERFGRLFKFCTPQLRLRMLGGTSDGRAKAGVTFTVPTAVWNSAVAV